MPTRVLLCDNADPPRMLLAELLREEPSAIVVGTARGGRECVRRAAELDPDVVLLDVAMPVLDGLKTLKVLRRGCPDIPCVVMLSSFDALRFRDRALELGAAAYVEKGAALDEIVAAIEGAADRRTHADRLDQIEQLTAPADGHA